MPKANETKNVKKTAEADKKIEKATEVDTKAVEVKAAEKKPAAKKTATKTTEKKETTKKAATKTTTAKKKIVESVCVQFAGNEYDVASIVEKAKAAYTGDAKKMKDIKIYVKPEEGMAYFVVNGDETGSVAL